MCSDVNIDINIYINNSKRTLSAGYSASSPSSSSGGGLDNGIGGQGPSLPVQPLLDREHAVRVVDGVVLALHSYERVQSYTREKEMWAEVQYSTVLCITAVHIAVQYT